MSASNLLHRQKYSFRFLHHAVLNADFFKKKFKSQVSCFSRWSNNYVSAKTRFITSVRNRDAGRKIEPFLVKQKKRFDPRFTLE